MDCHADKSARNDRNIGFSDNALFPSLRADEIGAAIHKQKELESTIDSLVYTLYNLTNDEIATIEKD